MVFYKKATSPKLAGHATSLKWYNIVSQVLKPPLNKTGRETDVRTVQGAEGKPSEDQEIEVLFNYTVFAKHVGIVHLACSSTASASTALGNFAVLIASVVYDVYRYQPILLVLPDI